MERTARRYSEMTSYRDEGVIRSWLDREDPAIEMPFETAYAAPNMYRYAFDCPHRFPALKHIVTRCIVGSDGHRAYVYRKHAERPAELDIVEDLRTSVASAAGVSSGASQIIARLLLPHLGGITLSELQDLSVAGLDCVEGVACRRVVGIHSQGQRWEVVIECESGLLRSVMRGSNDVLQYHRAIRVDEPVDLGLFAVPNVD